MCVCDFESKFFLIMLQDENLVREKAKNSYHSFLDQRLPEIKRENSEISSKNAYTIAREEWSQKKRQDNNIVKKPRGRPKKVVDPNQDNDSVVSGNSNGSNGKRGRPPKNPLINHLVNFEKFLKWSDKYVFGDLEEEFNKGQNDLNIDKETFQLFLGHLNPNSELRQLLNKKNAPKKNRGRPKGSKNKNTQEKEEINDQPEETPPEVIQFNQDLENIFDQIDNV